MSAFLGQVTPSSSPASRGLKTISVLSENSPGILHRVTVIFTRRKINIESLTVSETETHGISRYTIVVDVDSALLPKLVGQIARIVEVVDVYASTDVDLLFREIAFYRVRTANPSQRTEIEELAHRYGAVMAHVDGSSMVLEKTGTEEDVNSLYLLLEPFGIVEFVRSGRIALLRNLNSA